MKNFQNKPKTNIMHSLPMIALLFVLLVFLVVGVLGFAGRANDAYQNKKIARARIDELQERKAVLEQNIEELNTDFGKEKVFRENYGLGKPGEQVVIIVDEDTQDDTQEAKKSGFFQFFRNLFAR